MSLWTCKKCGVLTSFSGAFDLPSECKAGGECLFEFWNGPDGETPGTYAPRITQRETNDQDKNKANLPPPQPRFA